MLASSGQVDLAAAIRRDVPKRPGVYVFFDRFGNTLYVGKSVNLRARMSSYFAPGRHAADDRVSRMVFDVDRFRFRETASELLALLLEDAIIKRERPAYNVRQREYEACCYLSLTADRFPRLQTVGSYEDANGLIFGPFKDRYFAEEIRQAAGRYFGLRTCAEPVPWRGCANHDLGLCSGPCRGHLSAGNYQVVVGRVAAFLGGDETALVDRLQGRMNRRADRFDFEGAAKIRDELQFWTDFCRRQRFIQRFRTEKLVLRGRGKDRLLYHFEAGTLVRIVDELEPRDLAVPAELAELCPDPRFILDRANVMFARFD